MELLQDLAGYNRLLKPTGGTPVQFVGVYATTTIANAALIMQHGSGDIIVANVGQSTNGGASASTSATQAAYIAAGNTALISNQTTQYGI